MRTVKYKRGEELCPRGSALALGFFDGVHIGHRALLEHTVARAKRLGVESAVFTFAFGGGIKAGSTPIYTEEEREELFASLGIELCVIADFRELRDMTAEDFIENVVLGDLSAELCVVGYDYKFGRGGIGTAELLCEMMEKRGREAHVVEALVSRGEPVSSTRVRAFLEAGDVRAAWELLGEPYFVSGTVEHGREDGRRFGYPTINIPARKGAVRLRSGVYLTAVRIGGKLYTGLTNAGECPSFGKREYHTESFLTDYSGNAYGMETKVYFLSFLREETIFSSARQLGEQIEKDRLMAEKIKGDLKWQELGQSLR